MSKTIDRLAVFRHGYTTWNGDKYDTDKFMKVLKRKGLKLNGWTVNTHDKMKVLGIVPYNIVLSMTTNDLVVLNIHNYELVFTVYTQQGMKVRIPMREETEYQGLEERYMNSIGMNKEVIKLLLEWYRGLFGTEITKKQLPLSRTAKTLITNGRGFKNDTLQPNNLTLTQLMGEGEAYREINEFSKRTYGIGVEEALHLNFAQGVPLTAMWLTAETTCKEKARKGDVVNFYTIPRDSLIIQDKGKEGILLVTQENTNSMRFL